MIQTPDLVIIVIYVLGIVTIGLWSGLRKSSSPATTSGDYFLAGKTLRWPMIGLALFATNISTIHLVSLAQSGFDTGLLNGNFEWMAAFTLVLLAVFFVPFYIRSGVSTLPDFLEKRYNSACRDWLTIISIISSIVIHIGFSLVAGGIVIETLFGIDMYVSVLVILVLVGLYTIIGGLRAVVVTESIQTVLLLAGAVAITGFSFARLGGWSSLQEILESTGDTNKLSMLRPAGDGSGLPWYAVFLGYPVLGIWYWCADQTIVQRVLGARDENHARLGALFCGFIKILPVFIFVLPGLLAFALSKKGLLDIGPITTTMADGQSVVSSKGIYTLMITQLLPTGVVGIVVAALLSALMSTVSGALNSISTLVSYDFVKRVRPGTSDKALVNVGRLSAFFALMFSMLLIPLLNSYESLFNGLNDIIAHIAPPITCVFLLGIFWKNASAKSAQFTLWIGSLLGVVVYGYHKIFPSGFLGDTPFMMMAFYLFCICVVIQVIFSVIYPVIHTTESAALYWKTPLEPLKSRGWKGVGNYKFLSILLLAVMGLLYVVFQ